MVVGSENTLNSLCQHKNVNQVLNEYLDHCDVYVKHKLSSSKVNGKDVIKYRVTQINEQCKLLQEWMNVCKLYYDIDHKSDDFLK